MKKMYAQVSQMVKTSGIGFEAETCRFVCTDGSWKHFLIGKPKRWVLWETKRFPQYPLCQKLYDGTLATGEYASSSSAPCQYLYDNEQSDVDERQQSFRDDSEEEAFDRSMNESESDDGSPPQKKSSKRRSKSAPKGSGTIKRNRPSMASAMVSEMQQFREAGQNEINQILDALKNNSTQQTDALSASEIAVDLLQSNFSTTLSLEDMVIACEVMEYNKKASLFLRMNNDVKHAWLVRQISKQKN